VQFYFIEKDKFLYLLKGAPAVPTARSNRCFAVATPLALRQQAVFSLPCLGGDHWLRTGRLLRLRVETASCPTVGSPSQSLGLAHYNRAPRLRGGYPSVAQLAQCISARFSCRAPELCDDSADAGSVMMPPMHSSLFTSSRDKNSRRSFNMARGDVIPIFSKPSVTHIISSFIKIVKCVTSFL
jgi:hypothetical protein